MHIVPYRADGITVQVDSAQVRANLAQTGIDSWEGTSEDSSVVREKGRCQIRLLRSHAKTRRCEEEQR